MKHRTFQLLGKLNGVRASKKVDAFAISVAAERDSYNSQTSMLMHHDVDINKLGKNTYLR